MGLNLENEKEIFEEYVTKLESYMDKSVNPNEDFIKYCCGNYDKSGYKNIPTKLDEVTKLILEDESITHPCLAKARDFYKSVKDMNDFKGLLEHCGVYSTIGGLPVFEENWNGENFNWMHLIGILTSIDLPSIMKHHMYFLEDGERHVCSSLNKSDNIESVEEIFRKLNSSDQNIQQAVKDIKEIRNKMMGKRCAYQQSLFKVGRNVMESTHMLPSKSLKEYSEFDFQKYFEIWLGSPVNENDVFEMKDFPYLKDCMVIFSECEPRAVANYITWKAADSFFNKDYKLNLVKHHFVSAVIAATLDKYFTENDEGKRQKVFDIFQQSPTSQIDPQMENSLKTDVVLTRKDLLKSVFSMEKINNEYENLEINSDNFYENILNIQKHGLTDGQLKFITRKKERKILNVPYLQDIDSFIKNIIRSHNKPILYYFVHYGIHNLNDVKYFKITEGNKDLQEKGIELLKKQSEDRNLSCDNYTFEYSLANLAVLKDLYKEYQNWLNENEELANIQDKILSSYSLNNDQVFFIDFVQQYCSTSNFEEESSTCFLLTLLNFGQLSESFGLEIGSNMNPEVKCDEECYNV